MAESFGKVRISSIIIVLLYLTSFATFSDAYIPLYYFIKYIIMLIVAFYLVNKIRFFFSKDTPKFILTVNLLLVALCICLMISSLLNRNSPIRTRDYFFSSIIFVLGIIESFLIIEYISFKERMQDVYTIFFRLSFLANLVCDSIALVYPELQIQYGHIYLLGTKFNVVYSHIFMLAFFKLHQKKEKKSQNLVLGIMFLWSCAIASFVDCMTGVIALVFFFIVIFFMKKNYRWISNPWVYMTVIVVSALFVVTYDTILNLPIIRYILTECFGRSDELTGRAWIYNIIFEVLFTKPFLGNGYGSSYDIMMNFMHAPNTQNGFTEWIIEGGIISTAFFLILVWKIFSIADRGSKNTHIVIVCVILHMLALVASVEITLNRNFYMVWIAILLGITIERYCGCEDIESVYAEKEL